ncbi:MAG TPA: hypothetical protein VN808_06580, partial [Stellaceae bacterium]|nr:hypothetical protein [Stellaceae bacterium]
TQKVQINPGLSLSLDEKWGSRQHFSPLFSPGQLPASHRQSEEGPHVGHTSPDRGLALTSDPS